MGECSLSHRHVCATADGERAGDRQLLLTAGSVPAGSLVRTDSTDGTAAIVFARQRAKSGLNAAARKTGAGDDHL